MADNSDGGFLSGLILGGLVGAAVGMLYAPKSGEETRSELLDRTSELRGRAEDLAEDALKRAQELQKEAKLLQEEAKKWQERGAAALEEQRIRLEQAIEEGQQAAAKTRDELTGKEEAPKKRTRKAATKKS